MTLFDIINLQVKLQALPETVENHRDTAVSKNIQKC